MKPLQPILDMLEKADDPKQRVIDYFTPPKPKPIVVPTPEPAPEPTPIAPDYLEVYT